MNHFKILMDFVAPSFDYPTPHFAPTDAAVLKAGDQQQQPTEVLVFSCGRFLEPDWKQAQEKMGGIENALKALRSYPRVSIFNLRDLPYSKPPPYHGLKRKKRGLGHRGASQYQAYPPLGTQEGRTPFYITVPREPYNQDHFSRHALPRLSLLDLQRMIDLSRIDPTQPIDLTSFCNTGLFRLDVEHERHYGFHLTEENAIEYYTNAAFRGYLADPQEVASARIWLAEKYGYKAIPDPSAGPLKDLALVRKQPWQIFHGLEPGWLVSLTDRVVIKPKSPEHEEFYKG
ncbi:unnamed protein product [Dibothriocephalus latus]|uniref:Uncharacterized protein n=1 Tax=Dibothriocephalus latus TaxID=60516 RepID=A0A3P6TI44_DIBLA|nr:unnamed protein product [Dibothriocephalus latus]